MISGIYAILNWKNHKVYVGSATYLNKRMSEHSRLLRKDTHDNRYLQNAWNKHGENNFSFIVLEYCEKEKLIEREQYWIDRHNSSNSDKGYNLAKVAGNTAGVKWTEEQRIKYLAKRIGTKRSQEEKDKISLGMLGIKNRLGTRHSEETRIKMSEARRNKTQEQSDRQSAGQRNLEKWPHSAGCRCKCNECKIRASQYRKAKMENLNG